MAVVSDRPPELLSLADAAYASGKSYHAIWRACLRGDLLGQRVGRAWRVNANSLAAYLGRVDGELPKGDNAPIRDHR